MSVEVSWASRDLSWTTFICHLPRINIHTQIKLDLLYNWCNIFTHHVSILYIKAEIKLIISDQWYCSQDCILGTEGDDYVQNYSKSIMWEGLTNLCRKDAVREGDGAATLSDWKLDTINFWNMRHTKYFIIAHPLLASEYPIINVLRPPSKTYKNLYWKVEPIKTPK